MRGKLYTVEAIRAQAELRQQMQQHGWSLGGFHFCNDCQKITKLIGEDPFGCCHCGGHSYKFCPAVPAT